jgi:hypothetical protein
MSGQDAIQPLSEGAAAVLGKMQSGPVLVGNLGDYGRDFRLMSRGASDWANVKFSVVEELLRAGRIKSASQAGSQIEYEPT